MKTTPTLHARRAQPRRGFTLVELLTVIAVIGILAGILIPVTTGAIKAAKKAKTSAFLNNIVGGCTSYQTTYKYYPTLTTGSPGQDFVLNLQQQGRVFLNVMGGTPQNATEKQFNKRGEPFITFSDEQIGPGGNTLLDAFRNDTIIVVMDTDNNGQIASVNQSMQAGNVEDGYFKTISVSQNSPIFSRVIAMSPGYGVSNDDAVTTWEVKP